MPFLFDIGKVTDRSPTIRPVKSRRDSSSSTSSTRGNAMDHFKRPSIAKKRSTDGKASRASSSPLVSAAQHVAFDLVTESPPVLFLDSAQQSTGALYSVVTRMTVTASPASFNHVTLKLEAVSTTKRPVMERCKECSRQVTTIKEWTLVDKKQSFAPGVHDFPASHLIPGHLPVTTHGHISSVDYRIVLHATSVGGQDYNLERPLTVQRAVRPVGEKTSIRVFPPTNLSLTVTTPPVIHTMGDFNVYARMSGLVTKNGDTQTRWRLRKLDWRIEEHETSVSPACSKHSAKVGGDGRGVLHEHTRCIGEKEVKSGWKTDWTAGETEGEIVCHIDRSRKPNTEVESANGLKIKHTLVLEMIIAEEWAPNKKPNNATPTGVARVLRTQFNLTVTERAGMGISWDAEQPPLYEDVPASPPAYLHVTDYDGPELNEDIEHLHLG